MEEVETYLENIVEELGEDRVEEDKMEEVETYLESIVEALGEDRVEADDMEEVEPVVERHFLHVGHLGHVSAILS